MHQLHVTGRGWAAARLDSGVGMTPQERPQMNEAADDAGTAQKERR
jgi:hypothetical protein